MRQSPFLRSAVPLVLALLTVSCAVPVGQRGDDDKLFADPWQEPIGSLTVWGSPPDLGVDVALHPYVEESEVARVEIEVREQRDDGVRTGRAALVTRDERRESTHYIAPLVLDTEGPLGTLAIRAALTYIDHDPMWTPWHRIEVDGGHVSSTTPCEGECFEDP